MNLLDEAKAASAEFDKHAAEIKKQEIEREITFADRQLISQIKDGQQYEYIVNNSKNEELSPPKFKVTGENEMLRILEKHFKDEGFTTNVFERITHWGENHTVLSVRLPGEARVYHSGDLDFGGPKPGIDII